MIHTVIATTSLVLLILSVLLMLATIGAHSTTVSAWSGDVRIYRYEPAPAPATIPPVAQRRRPVRVDSREFGSNEFGALRYLKPDAFADNVPTRWACWTEAHCRQWLLVAAFALVWLVFAFWPNPPHRRSATRAAATAAGCLTLVVVCLIAISFGGGLSAKVANGALVLRRSHAAEPTAEVLDDVRRGLAGHIDTLGRARPRYDYHSVDLRIAVVATYISPTQWSYEGLFPGGRATAKGPWLRSIALECQLWLLLPLLAAYPIVVFVCQPRRRRRRSGTMCQLCGYDLTGNESGRCSECGQLVESE